ncbi:MAG: 16S rRNA (uracil(1498)-N(3))-methyltransferase [Candidatus Obscuribacterales bacterium]|nr:16S rRNA (uracil(1498)-N(3))-methyltransferase [Candidatus Obscuribacterales bacterium]
MRIPRFFLYGRDLEAFADARNNKTDGLLDIVEADLVHRIKVVQRHRTGDSLILLDNEGNKYDSVIAYIDKRSVRVLVGEKIASGGELRVSVTVAQSVVKGERFDWCLEKLTELGVSTVVPLVSARGVVKFDEATFEKSTPKVMTKLKRWQSLVREAAEQSERAFVPIVAAPAECIAYLSSPGGGGNGYLRYICLERSDAPMLIESLRNRFTNSAAGGASPRDQSGDAIAISSVFVVIGPEGGFTAHEIAIAENNGWEAVSLGARVLRSETAGMCAMAQIACLLD